MLVLLPGSLVYLSDFAPGRFRIHWSPWNLCATAITINIFLFIVASLLLARRRKPSCSRVSELRFACPLGWPGATLFDYCFTLLQWNSWRVHLADHKHDEKRDESFKVIDRRPFTAEGVLRQEVSRR